MSVLVTTPTMAPVLPQATTRFMCLSLSNLAAFVSRASPSMTTRRSRATGNMLSTNVMDPPPLDRERHRQASGSGLAFGDHFLDRRDGLARIQPFRTRPGAVQNGVATVEPKWVFEPV